MQVSPAHLSPTVHASPSSQLPLSHVPPQPSEPHCLPVQLGTQMQLWIGSKPGAGAPVVLHS